MTWRRICLGTPINSVNMHLPTNFYSQIFNGYRRQYAQSKRLRAGKLRNISLWGSQRLFPMQTSYHTKGGEWWGTWEESGGKCIEALQRWKAAKRGFSRTFLVFVVQDGSTPKVKEVSIRLKVQSPLVQKTGAELVSGENSPVTQKHINGAISKESSPIVLNSKAQEAFWNLSNAILLETKSGSCLQNIWNQRWWAKSDYWCKKL